MEWQNNVPQVEVVDDRVPTQRRDSVQLARHHPFRSGLLQVSKWRRLVINSISWNFSEVASN